MKPTYVAYRHQFRDRTFEWRVAPAREVASNQAPTKLGGSVVRGLIRDEAWRAARSLARAEKGLAFLMGGIGLEGRPVKFMTYSDTIGEPAPTDAIAARLTTHDLDQASPEFRKDIADWLRRQAAFIISTGKRATLSARYKATYYKRRGPQWRAA